ncbi:hypothetical protein WJX82_009755 [Trebouxia sp. C0006]
MHQGWELEQQTPEPCPDVLSGIKISREVKDSAIWLCQNYQTEQCKSSSMPNSADKLAYYWEVAICQSCVLHNS